MPITTTHRAIKTTLRAALADTNLFDDAHLVTMLDMARTGQMIWSEPCQCLIGLSNYGYYCQGELTRYKIRDLEQVEHDFRRLGYPTGEPESAFGQEIEDLDARRNRRLVPMILREIRTRSRQPTGRTAQLSMAPSMAPATKFQMVD